MTTQQPDALTRELYRLREQNQREHRETMARDEARHRELLARLDAQRADAQARHRELLARSEADARHAELMARFDARSAYIDRAFRTRFFQNIGIAAFVVGAVSLINHLTR